MKGFDLSFNSVLFLKKRMSLTLNCFVFLVPVTLRYSQLLMPKKKAPLANCPIASSFGVNLLSSSFLNTDKGKAFSCFSDGSASIYPANCLTNTNDVLLSGSNAGSDWRWVLKVDRTFEMVDLTVLPQSPGLFVLPYKFLLQAPANAEIR